jgi:hypothetical protein
MTLSLLPIPLSRGSYSSRNLQLQSMATITQ